MSAGQSVIDESQDEAADEVEDDSTRVLLAVHIIYETHASGARASAGEPERFRGYSAKYAAQGPQGAIVRGWRKALGIR